MNLRRPIVLAVSIAAAFAACGGDDASTPAEPTTIATGSDEPSTEPTAPADGVVPTIAPDLPEALLPGVGPLAVIGDLLPPLPQTGVDPAIGMQAPIIVAETVVGEPVTVDASVDGPTWLVFLAHWCPHCNAEIPVINGLRDEGQIPDGLNVVGVSTAYDPGRPNWPPAEWFVEKDWTYTAIQDGIDPEAAIPYIALEAFGVSGYPFSVLLDSEGRVVTRWSGERAPDELVALIESALG